MADPADAIYIGADIVTLDDANPSAQALAVRDGRITAVGVAPTSLPPSRVRLRRSSTSDGATLLPGFIDPHSHYITSLTVANQVNVFAPPAGPGADVGAIVAALQGFRDSHPIPPGEMLVAYGYDDTLMPGGRTLDKADLDADFPDTPVLVGHVSMHGAVLNIAAMRKFDITAATVTPPGGVIVRKEGSTEPDGLVMETAFLPIFAAMPKPTPAQEVAWSKAGQMLYAAAGITTRTRALPMRPTSN